MERWRAHLLALGGVALVAGLGLAGIQATVPEVYTAQPLASVVVGELVTSARACQSFIAHYPGLRSVEVPLSVSGQRDPGPVLFRMEGAEEIVSLALSGSEVDGGAYSVFSFPPIHDSAGRRFTFCLEAPEAKPGSGVVLRGTWEDVYPEGEALLEGLHGPDVRDLTFRAEYEPTLISRLGVFLERVAEGKPSLWGDRRFYLLLFGVYLCLLYGLLVHLATVGRGGKGGPER